MAAPKGALILAGIAFCVGIGLGHNSAEVPPARVVKVPTVKTHVEYRDKPTPLPQSCREAVQLTLASTTADDDIAAGSGKMQLAMSDVLKNTGNRDMPALTKAMEQVMASKNLVDNGVVDKSEIVSRLTDALARCKDEVSGRS